jgi:integrase
MMAGKLRHFMERDGRFFARLVIPTILRPYLDNKTELRAPLGGDRRAAIRLHPAAVADLMEKISVAEQQLAAANGTAALPGRYPLTVQQIALRSYEARLKQDNDARNTLPSYGMFEVDDGYVAMLRNGIAGTASNAELEELLGHRIDYFRQVGNTTAQKGTPEWRELAHALCKSELEALTRVIERDEANFSGTPTDPILRDVPSPEPEAAPISLVGLFEDYIALRHYLGRGKGAEDRWKSVFPNLVSHLGHDDARKITKKDIIAWRDKLKLTLAPSTINKVHLTAVKAVLNWAVAEDLLDENPAKEVRQEMPKHVRSREQGYTKDEANAVLLFAYNYEPKPLNEGAIREHPEMSAAKKWVPLLLAYSGARVVELTQLRKMDIVLEGEIYVMRITPEAGTVKSGGYRDVPIHPALVEAGFISFISAVRSGPFFVSEDGKGTVLKRAQTTGNRIAEWLKKAGLVPPEVSPNHGWRHRFKTVAREEGQSDRIVDAICGHAGRTAGDAYGDVTIKAKYKVIAAMPAYDLTVHHQKRQFSCSTDDADLEPI